MRHLFTILATIAMVFIEKLSCFPLSRLSGCRGRVEPFDDPLPLGEKFFERLVVLHPVVPISMMKFLVVRDQNQETGGRLVWQFLNPDELSDVASGCDSAHCVDLNCSASMR